MFGKKLAVILSTNMNNIELNLVMQMASNKGM